MVHPIKQGKTERQSYSRINEVIEVPNLIDIQKDSYNWFINEGMQQILDEISPVTDSQGIYEIYFLGKKFDPAQATDPEKPATDKKAGEISDLSPEDIIDKCKNVAAQIGTDAVLNQWYDIEAAWKKCRRGNESLYHISGDTDGFATAFCDGLLKLSVILPDIKTDPEPKDKSEPRYVAVEKTMAVCAKMKPSITRFQLLCGVVRDGMEAACNGDPDFDVWEQPWLAAAFQLLSEDPCRGECNK